MDQTKATGGCRVGRTSSDGPADQAVRGTAEEASLTGMLPKNVLMN